MAPLLPLHVSPHVLNWVQIWAVGRQGQYLNAIVIFSVNYNRSSMYNTLVDDEF